jgi:hypothetical protein
VATVEMALARFSCHRRFDDPNGGYERHKRLSLRPSPRFCRPSRPRNPNRTNLRLHVFVVEDPTDGFKVTATWISDLTSTQLRRTHTIPYHEDGVAAMGSYVTVFTRFAAPAPGVVFREKVKVIGKG